MARQVKGQQKTHYVCDYYCLHRVVDWGLTAHEPITEPYTPENKTITDAIISSSDDSFLQGWKFVNCDISYVEIKKSTIIVSGIAGCGIEDSAIEGSEAERCTIRKSTIKDSTLKDSKIWDSKIKQGAVKKSTIKKSTIEGSEAERCTIRKSTITDSTLKAAITSTSQLHNCDGQGGEPHERAKIAPTAQDPHYIVYNNVIYLKGQDTKKPQHCNSFNNKTLSGSIINAADSPKVRLHGWTLINCAITGIRLTDCTLTGCTITDCTFYDSTVMRSTIVNQQKKKRKKRNTYTCTIDKSTIEDSEITGAVIEQSAIEDSSLVNCEINSERKVSTKISNSDITGCEIQKKTTLNNCTLTRCIQKKSWNKT